MATQRADPYSNFNFLVQLRTDTTTSAGFQEVSGMNIEVTSADYRVGNSPVNHPVKVNGVYKVGDVTLKRGLIGATDLYQLIDGIRTGNHTVPERAGAAAGRGPQRPGLHLHPRRTPGPSGTRRPPSTPRAGPRWPSRSWSSPAKTCRWK